jgi:predicted DNA-binding WGR domain protein
MLLVRIDPAQQIDRWYSVEVQPTLFDGCAVVCQWGSRHTTYDHYRIVAASPQLAEGIAEAIIVKKIARGYRRAS